MVKKIMIVVPPNIVPSENLRRIGEPLGALSIATYLKTKGFDVDVYDMTLEGYDNCKQESNFIVYGSELDDLKQRILKFKPDLVGVSSMFSSKERITDNVCKTIKGVDSNIIVVVGGMPPTSNPEIYLKSRSVDFVVLNDGEVRLEKLINNLNNSKSPDSDLDGIAYIDDSQCGKLIRVPSIEINKYFTVLPYPDRSLVDMKKYFEIGRPYAPFCEGRRVAHIVASKGCPFNCIFCAAVNFVGHRVHHRLVENISQEIKELVEKYQVEEIQFMDDNLTIDKRFAENLFSGIKKFKIKWCTPNGLYFNSLDEQLLELMAQSGCYQITMAIESGSERVLKEVIRKNVKIDNVKTLVDIAHSLRMSVHGLFVVGIPGETLDELHKTLDFPFENNFDSVSFSIASAFEGTRLWQLCNEKGYKIKDTALTTYLQSNFIVPEGSSDFVMTAEELERLIDQTSKKFYDWSKSKFPEIWGKKYGTFLSKKHEREDNLKRRI